MLSRNNKNISQKYYSTSNLKIKNIHHMRPIKNVHNNIQIKRFMQKSVGTTTPLMRRAMSPNIASRYYPGQYKIVKWRKSISENDKRRLNLTQHETTHYNIQDTRTGKIEAIMTSAQNKSGKNPASFDKIDPVKVDGSFTPKTDPTSGKIELDKNGQSIPDLKKGGQYMVTLSKPRQLGNDTKHMYDVNKEGQSYVDKHEKTIENNINKIRRPTVSKKIGGIDDE